MSHKGKFIVIEGGDGTGKSTQVEIITNELHKRGIETLEVYNDDTNQMEPIREPGGVPIANELRKVILNRHLERDPWTNVMLFTANRRVNWLQAIKPALDSGKWVVCSRSWISTLVYQGYGEGIDIKRITDYVEQNIGIEYMNPDVLLILQVDNHLVREGRIGNRIKPKNPDTFESMPREFQDKLLNGFTRYSTDSNTPMVDASKSIHSVSKDIWRYIEPLIVKESK